MRARVPVLLLSNRYDESTSLINETMKRGLKGSEWRARIVKWCGWDLNPPQLEMSPV
jgi:hypothetical protein